MNHKAGLPSNFDTDWTLIQGNPNPTLNEPHNDIHDILMAMLDINAKQYTSQTEHI